MNFNIEDNIDFWEELSTAINATSNEVVNEQNICLLTQSPLERHAITLPCKHTFNYIPLINEVTAFKTCKRVFNSMKALELYQFLCPYCRTIHNGVLPFIPNCGVNRIIGVNAPSTRSISHKTCQHKFTTGKRKGQLCNKTAYETDYGNKCHSHALSKPKQPPSSNKKSLQGRGKRPQDWDNWTIEMQNDWSKTISELRSILNSISSIQVYSRLRCKADYIRAIHKTK